MELPINATCRAIQLRPAKADAHDMFQSGSFVRKTDEEIAAGKSGEAEGDFVIPPRDGPSVRQG
jgi:hypothetical protein